MHTLILFTAYYTAFAAFFHVVSASLVYGRAFPDASIMLAWHANDRIFLARFALHAWLIIFYTLAAVAIWVFPSSLRLAYVFAGLLFAHGVIELIRCFFGAYQRSWYATGYFLVIFVISKLRFEQCSHNFDGDAFGELSRVPAWIPLFLAAFFIILAV